MTYAHAFSHGLQHPAGSAPQAPAARLVERRGAARGDAVDARVQHGVALRADTPALDAYAANLRRLAARRAGDAQPGAYALLAGVGRG